ncbi:MAG: hypothetical protein MH321_08510 [Leptospiraceae bacterium]|nr:hypothetical protein [Leptospiraceae bacterium]
MKKLFLTSILLTLCFTNLALFSDSVKINKTGTVFENVKTTTDKGVVSVDFEDKTNKKFRTKDVTVTPGETVWLADKPVEEPGFFAKLFKGDAKDDEKNDSPTSVDSKPESEKESGEKSYLAEGIFGGVALLWLLLP